MYGPAQLNIHLEGVSDHGDKDELVFFVTFHVLETACRQCRLRAEALSAVLARACGCYSAPNKNSFRSDQHSTHARNSRRRLYSSARAGP
jgi:hypothetical protein